MLIAITHVGLKVSGLKAEPNFQLRLSEAKKDTGNVIPGSPRNIQVFRSLTPKHEAGQPKANQTAADLITTLVNRKNSGGS